MSNPKNRENYYGEFEWQRLHRNARPQRRRAGAAVGHSGRAEKEVSSRRADAVVASPDGFLAVLRQIDPHAERLRSWHDAAWRARTLFRFRCHADQPRRNARGHGQNFSRDGPRHLHPARSGAERGQHVHAEDGGRSECADHQHAVRRGPSDADARRHHDDPRKVWHRPQRAQDCRELGVCSVLCQAAQRAAGTHHADDAGSAWMCRWHTRRVTS